MSNMFEEIEKEKRELPEIKIVTKHLTGKRKLNFYQIVAIIVFMIGFIGSILLGNMIPSCTNTNVFGQCNSTEFNISLTLISWISVFLFSLFLFSIGHIINILESIDKKIK